ncbi:MAG: hypothetical protein WBW99_21915 [Pseudolabrys sp.]
MDRSLFLARLMGPTFVAIALGMLINLGTYESMIAEALHTGILFYLSGLLSLLAGLAIVNLHNMWCADWRVIVTVLGAAISHAKSLTERLADEAPVDTTVSVLDEAGIEIATYSVASWRMAVHFHQR